jgi:hypothetical protein
MKSLWKRCLALVLGGPLGLWIGEFYPPWPENAGLYHAVVAITACTLGVLLVNALAPRSGRPEIMGISLALIFLLAYLFLNVRFVETLSRQVGEQTSTIKVIKGHALRPEIVTLGRSDRLHYFGSPERIWTGESVTTVRLSLASAYHLMLFFATLSLAFAAKQRSKPRKVAAPK